MTRRRGVIGLLVGLVVGGLIALMAVVVWRIYVDVRTREVTAEQCESESDSGWCVQRRHRPEGLLTDEETTLYFAHRAGDTYGPRVTVAPYPFLDTDGQITVEFVSGGIVVSDERGVSVTYPEAFYELD